MNDQQLLTDFYRFNWMTFKNIDFLLILFTYTEVLSERGGQHWWIFELKLQNIQKNWWTLTFFFFLAIVTLHDCILWFSSPNKNGILYHNCLVLFCLSFMGLKLYMVGGLNISLVEDYKRVEERKWFDIIFQYHHLFNFS